MDSPNDLESMPKEEREALRGGWERYVDFSFDAHEQPKPEPHPLCTCPIVILQLDSRCSHGL